MKQNLLLILTLFAGITTNCQNKDCSGGWAKYENNPVLGGENFGTLYDVSVLKTDAGTYQMYLSWYEGAGIALSESKDGLKWTSPVVCLNITNDKRQEGDGRSGKDIEKPAVILKDGVYHIWYTIKASENEKWQAWIGYAVSNDGKNWTKQFDKSLASTDIKGLSINSDGETWGTSIDKPVLSPDVSWEKGAVQSPHVIWDDQEQCFKMWYSAGNVFEPDAIGYATSKDGLHWEKYRNNPVFVPDKENQWEQAKVAGCQVIKRTNDYLMFYIGYSDAEHAKIGMARSKDGITNWERYNGNPVIKPGIGWDADGVYKPFAVPDAGNNRWLLYYNGRRGWREQIGVAVHEGMDLGF